MRTENRIDTLHASRRDHTARSAVSLLVGLEKELHRSRERFTVLRQQHGRAENCRCVHIMTAGMHNSGRLRCKIHPGGLRDGKCVHVRTEGCRFPRFASGQCSHNAGFRHALCLDSKSVERFFDQLRSLEFLISHFRIPVNLLTNGIKFVCTGLRPIKSVHRFKFRSPFPLYYNRNCLT